MSFDLVWRLAAGLLLIAGNAFFVAVEFALTRLRGLDLDESQIDDEGLRVAWDLTERLELNLTACQLGISSTSVVLGVVAEPAITRLVEPVVGLAGLGGNSTRTVSVVVALVILNLIHKIWGEQAPTYLGVERPREVARALAPALAVWSKITAPIVNLGDGLAKSSLRIFGVEITRSWTEPDGEAGGESDGSPGSLAHRIDGIIGDREISSDREEEILQAVRIDEVPASDEMVPIDEVVFLSLDDSPAAIFERIAAAGHTRYPVMSSSGAAPSRRASVSGICYVPALFGLWRSGVPDTVDLDPLISAPCYLPADTCIADVIDRLQERGEEVAMLTDVSDEQRLVGMITVSDAFEVIAGELSDPLDPGPHRRDQPRR